MNKLKVFLFICLYSINIVAQNHPLVGTWEGIVTYQLPDSESDGMKDYQHKLIIRINKYDKSYVVRAKNVSIDNPSNVKYWNDCNVYYSDEINIRWNSYMSTSYDWDVSDGKNGQTIYCADYSMICDVTFLNGRINLIRYMHTDYKNRKGEIIGTHDNPIEKFSLYKQEEDW